MRKLPQFNLFNLVVVLCLFSLASCTSEDLFSEVISQNQDETSDSTTTPGGSQTAVTIEPLVINSTPCSYDLSSLSSNESLSIECRLDLDGETVNLPENVTLIYGGGEIINGTLNFSGGKIDGNLLNIKLNVAGNTSLIDPTFLFHKDRWAIVEGSVGKDVAQKNGETLQSVIDMVKRLNGYTFTLDNVDGYFYRNSFWEHPAKLPSDFHFKMSDLTHLRVFPTDNDWSNILINIRDVSNVKVSGGHLHGDRDTHTGTMPYHNSNLLQVKSGKNIEVNGVRFVKSIVDGITVNSSNHAYEAAYSPSSNVLITGCTFDTNRRLNLSITDGEDIIVENCTFLNASIDTPNSEGIAPGYAIDIEPITNDVTRPQQIVERVTIRNNTESGSRQGALVAYDGNDITISGNSFEKFIAYNAAANVKIVNNPSLTGILAGKKDWYDRSRNKNTIISGNTISGGIGNIGIIAVNQDIQIFDNKILNCLIGIQMDGLMDSVISNNEIKSTREDSHAFTALDYVGNVTIKENNVDVKGRSFRLDYINRDAEEEGNVLTIENNSIKTGDYGLLRGCFGVSFLNNIFNQGFRFEATENIKFEGNDLITDGPFGIELRDKSLDKLTIINNKIETLNTAGQGPGIVTKNVDMSERMHDIVISDNIFKVNGTNISVDIEGYNGIKMENNIGNISNDRAFIFYRGNNSIFKNNALTTGETRYDVVGSGNVVE